MSTILECVLSKLENFELSYKSQVAKYSILSIALQSGSTYRLTFTASISGVLPGQYVYIDFGDNSGYHKITNVGSNFVDYDDSAAVAQGQFGSGTIYNIQTNNLNEIINTQLYYVKKITGFTFTGIQTINEVHDGSGTEELMLNYRPVNEVLAISWLSLPNNILSIPVSAVEIMGQMGVLRVRAINLESYTLQAPVWPKGRSNVKIQYTTGFADYPADVKNAICLLASSAVLGYEAAFCGGGLSLSVVNYSKSWGPRGKYENIRNDFVLQARAILKAYQTAVVGN